MQQAASAPTDNPRYYPIEPPIPAVARYGLAWGGGQPVGVRIIGIDKSDPKFAWILSTINQKHKMLHANLRLDDQNRERFSAEQAKNQTVVPPEPGAKPKVNLGRRKTDQRRSIATG